MNPDDYEYTSDYAYTSSYYDSIMKAARRYHTTVDFTADKDVLDDLLGKANAKASASAPEPVSVPDEPYDNAQIIREIDYSNFTIEELDQAIDYLHEVLLHKRRESLLDLEPGLE